MGDFDEKGTVLQKQSKRKGKEAERAETDRHCSDGGGGLLSAVVLYERGLPAHRGDVATPRNSPRIRSVMGEASRVGIQSVNPRIFLTCPLSLVREPPPPRVVFPSDTGAAIGGKAR